MKRYKKPVIKFVDLKDEVMMGTGSQEGYGGQFAKQNNIQIQNDEYLDENVSYSKNAIDRDEEQW